MIIKSIVVIDGKEVEVKELEDKEAFAESVNQRVLFDRNYIIEKPASAVERNDKHGRD